MKRPAAKSSGSKALGVLWLLTGILIGLFVASLLFLKKHVTVVQQNDQVTTETVATAPAVAAPATVPSKEAAKPKHHPAAAHKEAPTASGDQYDFYTMLPKMQVGQSASSASTASEPTSPAASAKPTKPLADAEQSMLNHVAAGTATNTAVGGSATGQASVAVTASASATTTAAPVATTTAESPTPVAPPPVVTPKAKPAPASKPAVSKSMTETTSHYQVVVGSYNHADEADAQKAALTLAGFDHIRVQKSTKNNVMWYRVYLGNYQNKEEAEKVLNRLQENQFNGTIQTK